MNNTRILIAEDEAVLRFLLTETLEEEGFEVTEAEDGGEAAALLASETFDLIILDYMMPEATGIEVCERLRSENGPNASKPVILLTAKVQEQDRIRAKTAGVSRFMAKPFSPIQLLEEIEGLMEQPGTAE